MNWFKKIVRRFDFWLHRPRVRVLDDYGQPLCWNCHERTNKAYAKHRKLICWNCGASFPDLHD